VEAGSATMEVTSDVSVARDEGTLATVARGEGVVDFTARRARATLTASQESDRTAQTRPCEVVMDADRAFLRIPESHRQAHGEKAWMRLEAVANNALDINWVLVEPTLSLDHMRAAGSTAARVGTEDVRGARTTRYRFTVTVKELIEALPPPRRAATESRLEQLRVSEVTAEAWIDDGGRPRRLVTDTSSSDRRFSMKTTTELLEYGRPVEIELPPTEETVRAPDQRPAFAVCFGQSTS